MVLQLRLVSHVRNKDFWTHGVAFMSKDQSLNKAHVQYLEAQLVQLAREVKRCELDYANIPQKPSLSDADMADAELISGRHVAMPACSWSEFLSTCRGN